MASSSSSTAPHPPSHHQRVMEKPNQELLQQQQEALKCPRCDSSNTKFCYYNNYSLSQPRHFCKACKRYWTRGGTLRNVPVGGGCRKNKRIKRPINSASSDQTHHNIITAAATVSSAVSNPPSQSHQIDVASTSNHINPLFYGMNLQFPRFNSSSGFDHHHLQPQMNNSSLGLDFTDNIGYRNGFSSNHSLLSSYSSSSIFANSSSTSTTTTSTTAPPIMASLLSSTNLQQQKFINNGAVTNNSTFLQGFINNNSSNGTNTEAEMVALKEVKSVVAVEDDNNRFLGGWQNNNQIEHQTGLMSDPSSLYWNTAATSLGTTNWNDQTNIGPHQSLLSSDLQ